jgi:2-dehydro-3-deoxyphosphooctonate aldolase (KDO 8-P synthase)
MSSFSSPRPPRRTASVHVGPVTIGPGHPLALISGPCVVEDPETMDRTAEGLVELCRRHEVPLIFKSSYEKDNRTAADAYRGPGLQAGLAALERLKERFGLPVTSDVHRVSDVEPAARVLDLIQVPALLCRQTSLLEAAGRAGRPVNVKKGQFIAPQAMKGAVDKLGEAEVLLTERGSCFGHERLVCDLTCLSVLRSLGCPVCVDAGHASNRRDEIPLLARAGVAAGADALFVEVHPDPGRARCDGSRTLSLLELEEILPGLVGLARAVREQG